MTNLLFIGNSFTARNNMPQLLVDLAAARGHDVRFTLIQAGGASLRMHWNKGDALAAIQKTRFDWVVLQEQSTLPVKNAARMHENIELFAEPIAAGHAKMALYLTWARGNAPESQAAITKAYTSIGKKLGATVAPAGVAWEKFMARHDAPMLHDKDMSHPTLAGSYLAACVFLSVMFKENPAGIATELKGISAAQRLALQKTAWAASNGVKKSAKQGTPHEHFHKDGSIWARGELRDGVMTGYWEWFRKDGSLMRTGSFVDGEQAGDWTTYAADGRVVKVTTMKPKSAKAHAVKTGKALTSKDKT